MGFIARQPNGRICRFSTFWDTVTDYNMTDDEFIEMYVEQAKREAERMLENDAGLCSFELVKESFAPNKMTQEQFDELVKVMEKRVLNNDKGVHLEE